MNIVLNPMNIIFPLRGEEVLLGIKKRKIGVGLWNGWGGKVEPGETMAESAHNELLKESSLRASPEDFIKVAVVDFYIHKSPSDIVLNRCDILFVYKFTGKEQESEEMGTPTWFPLTKIPYRKMMKDAEFWMPQVLLGYNIHAEIHYNTDRTQLLGNPVSWNLNLD